ncbi:class I SAM-dependent methyltransferase [Candidatus Woesearchaeota archaeon]|nr:class I SAM-dependent methyltransferase [Candidatus Woesearchaeota archaeon]
MAIKEWSKSWYWELGGARIWVADKLNLRAGMNVLDVGAGDGLFSIQAGQKYNGVKFIGIEYSGEYEEAKENAEELKMKNAEFNFMNAFDMKFKKKFDRVVFFISFRNIPTNKEEMLKLFNAIKKVLKKDGTLAIAEMFEEDAENEAQKTAQKIYKECSQFGDEHHKGIEEFFSIEEVKSALRKSNFKILAIDTFETRIKLSAHESRDFIKGEAGKNWKTIWDKYKDKIRELGGIEPDANISLIVAKMQ